MSGYKVIKTESSGVPTSELSQRTVTVVIEQAKEYKKQLESKDQQIKDLTELVEEAKTFMGIYYPMHSNSESMNHFIMKLESYQQKYPKP